MHFIAPFDEFKRETVLHVQQFPDYTLEIRPLSLTRDIAVLHRWVNMDYAKTFWQMEGSYARIYHHYEKFLASGLGDSLMFFYPGNIGIHLLMGPPTSPVKGLTTHVMLCGISYLFILGAQRIIGEPDINNTNANELVKRAGFEFVKPITLSYKTANLYFLEKANFLKKL
jgi:hypothetical protein